MKNYTKPPHKPKLVLEYCYCNLCMEYYKKVRIPRVKRFVPYEIDLKATVKKLGL